MKDNLFRIRKHKRQGYTVSYKPVGPMDEGLKFFDDITSLGQYLRFHKDQELEFVGDVPLTDKEKAEIGCQKCRRKVELLETGFCEDCQEDMETLEHWGIK